MITTSIVIKKRNPHFHIVASGFPINKVHIDLKLSNINDILNSRSELNKAMNSAIYMLKKEIFDKFTNIS